MKSDQFKEIFPGVRPPQACQPRNVISNRGIKYQYQSSIVVSSSPDNRQRIEVNRISLVFVSLFHQLLVPGTLQPETAGRYVVNKQTRKSHILKQIFCRYGKKNRMHIQSRPCRLASQAEGLPESRESLLSTGGKFHVHGICSICTTQIGFLGACIYGV